MTIQPDLFDPDSVWTPPPPVTPIFDRQAARRLRDEAIGRVDHHADPVWKKQADFAIRSVATEHAEFSTDDVWQALHDLAVDMPHEPRALGAAMRRAAKDGIIAPTNRTVNSARPECHCRPVRIWESRIR